MTYRRIDHEAEGFDPRQPQCESPVQEPLIGWCISRDKRRGNVRRAERLGYDPAKCQHQATINVHGKLLCQKHAGSRALLEALGEWP